MCGRLWTGGHWAVGTLTGIIRCFMVKETCYLQSVSTHCSLAVCFPPAIFPGYSYDDLSMMTPAVKSEKLEVVGDEEEEGSLRGSCELDESDTETQVRKFFTAEQRFSNCWL